jgi:hypothetical protein
MNQMTTPVVVTTADPVVRPSSSYNVRDFIDAKQLKKDLTFSNTNLTDAMMTQAAIFSHYGVISADAARQVDVVKLLLDSTESAVYRMIRAKMQDEGEKFTEVLLDKMVSRHERVVGMRQALNEAKRVESICKNAVEAFRHRRDMLVQMGLISREEMKGETRVAVKNAHEEARDEQQRQNMARIQRMRGGAEE